jgi:hypothetical protein
MNNLLINYQSDILTLFKHHYRQMVTKSTDLNFEDILNKTLIELGLTQTKKEDNSFSRVLWLLCKG